MLDRLIEARSLLQPAAAAAGLGKVSYLPFIIKATSLALEQYPSLNAHVTPDVTETIEREDRGCCIVASRCTCIRVEYERGQAACRM